MKVTICQGRHPQVEDADVIIVIDVIRAFTFTHIGFLHGVERFLMVKTVEEAWSLKEQYPSYLLAGEVSGLPIKGFDLGNSPSQLLHHDVKQKSFIQKTTNGVEAALNCLHVDRLVITGFSNARTTAQFVKNTNPDHVVIVASHPSSDEDVACAEYMKGLIDDSYCLSPKHVMKRIEKAECAQKFFDDDHPEFDRDDIVMCTKEIESSFVMTVNRNQEIPTIVRYEL